ncbi:MAG: hypothetical protein IPN05_19810 [Sulfuritalea sp.]|nr:hypothetical protein [Sulfuritalea sp.]
MSRSITGATGGNFETLAASTVARRAHHHDDTIGTTTGEPHGRPAIAEGGNITYTATLGATAHGHVLVTIRRQRHHHRQRRHRRRERRRPDEDVSGRQHGRGITGAAGGNFGAWRPRRWRRPPASPTPSAPPR